MNRVLPFPKEKSKRVRDRKRIEGQRLILILSLCSFILVAVFTNEQLMKNNRPIYLIADNSSHGLEQVNRAIASAQPMNMFRDVEWEHELAKRLADKADRQPASISTKPTLLDHLRYGELAGKYHILSSGDSSQVAEVEYIDSTEISDRPVRIKDREGFLLKYGKLLPIEFTKTALVETKDLVETWSLISGQGKTVGKAKLRFDESGQFLGLKVQEMNPVSAE